MNKSFAMRFQGLLQKLGCEMSRLEELLQEFCSNGVQYIKLNTLCEIYDGTHNTPNYTQGGIKFVSVQNINDLYSTNKYVSLEDFENYKISPQLGDVLMTRIGSIGLCAIVDRDEPLAYYVSLALLRPDASKINNKYLKYVIESIHGRKELRKRTLVNAVPIKINKADIGKISIPLPPLPVQEEIVRILDNLLEYTQDLVKNLELEIDARNKQFEYYKHELIGTCDNDSIVKIGDVCRIVTGGEAPDDCIKGNSQDMHHPYAVWGNGKDVYGYSSTYKIDKDSVVISSIGANTGAVYFHKAYFTPIIRLKVLIPLDENNINTRYLYHALSSIKIESKSSSVPNMNANDIKKLNIPLPDIKEQERIVNILDKYEDVYNNINSELLVELTTRQKQYDYYMNKLLDFNKDGIIDSHTYHCD